MGIKIIALAILLFFATAFYQMVNLDLSLSQERRAILNLKIAAEAGSTKWDEEATAEAGLIIIDELVALEKATELFYKNYPDADLHLFEVEIVNNAPTTRFKNGLEHSFISNGVMVSYAGFTQIAEADDRKNLEYGGLENDD